MSSLPAKNISIDDITEYLSNIDGNDIQENSIAVSKIKNLSDQTLDSFQGNLTKSRISDFPTIPTNFDTQYYRKEQFVHNLPTNSLYKSFTLIIGWNWNMRALIYTPNLFCVGGRPRHQYRYIVSASPNRDHDVSLNVIHFVVSYNEKGSVESSKFNWQLLYSTNASHWDVVFVDRDRFAIDFQGPDKFDYMNVNIR